MELDVIPPIVTIEILEAFCELISPVDAFDSMRVVTLLEMLASLEIVMSAYTLQTALAPSVKAMTIAAVLMRGSPVSQTGASSCVCIRTRNAVRRFQTCQCIMCCRCA